MNRLAPALLLAAACAGPSPTAREPPPVAPAPPREPAWIVVPPPSLPRCVELDSLRVDASWSPLPWHDGRRWLRVQTATSTLSAPAPAPRAPSIAGCAAVTGPGAPAPGPWPAPTSAPLVLFGCVPDEGAREVAFSVEVPCRHGPGRRTIEATIDVDREEPADERLAARVAVLPPTPPEEQGLAVELQVWRAREELPAWLAPHVPAGFDFQRFVLAGSDEAGAYTKVVVVEPEQPPTRIGPVRRVELRHPKPTCPPCRGVVDARGPMPEVVRPPLVLWKLPREEGRVFLLEHFGMCPPCFAP